MHTVSFIHDRAFVYRLEHSIITAALLEACVHHDLWGESGEWTAD